jgi:hypothetical protein
MPKLIIQRGHCYRTSGATGTAGEQSYATAVAAACIRLLDNQGGWRVLPTLADENNYHGDAFVAVHCDGSVHASARGASVGYRTPEGQAFAQAWKRAYAELGWPLFRPDNYTTALAGYYGVRNAVNVGTRRAIIIECGFLTNEEDRTLLWESGGPERVARAIGAALGIPLQQHDEPKEINNVGMYFLQGGNGKLEGTNVYLQAGPFFVGLDGGARDDAVAAVLQRGAPHQWVGEAEIADLDRRSHALYDKGPVTDQLKSIAASQTALGSLLQQTIDLLGQIAENTAPSESGQ